MTSRKLISVGCVAQNGAEFYVKLVDAWSKEECSEFVIETILSRPDGGDARMTEAVAASRLCCWIEGY